MRHVMKYGARTLRGWRAMRLTIATGLLLATAPAVAHANSCWIGLRLSTVTPDMSGTRSPGDWDDASVLESGNGCLNMLLDGSPGATVERTVRVYSKRNTTHLFFLFEVGNATMSLDASGSLGEKIILQIDADHSRDATIDAGGGDQRFEFTHRWSPATHITRSRFVSAPPTSLCAPGFNNWAVAPNLGGAVMEYQANIAGAGGGYSVEMSIPLSSLGITFPGPTALGLAFAIVNDLDGSGYYSAARFPESLPFTTQANGLLAPGAEDDPNGCNDWLSPAKWGSAYFVAAPADVTFSHDPKYWMSDAVLAEDCTGTAGYQYHPANACQLQISATPDNSAGPATRNLLYLWGDHDAGQVRWTFMELKEGVIIPPGGGVPFVSDLFNTPSGLNAHPCIRVYVLPSSYRADFTKADIEALHQAPHSDILDFESKYGLQKIHSAQRNLTRLPTTSSCPSGMCPSTAWHGAPLDLQLAQLLHVDAAAERLLSLFRPAPLAAQRAQDPQVPRDQPRLPVYWSENDQERFARDNVAVQVQTYGYMHQRPGSRHDYRIVEEISGILQLFPAELAARQRVPLNFNVTTPGTTAPYTIWLQVAQAVPPGMPAVTVDVPTGLTVYQPGQTRQIRGSVAPAGTLIPGCPFGAGGSAAAGFGFVFLAFVYHRRRQWR